MVPPEPSSHPGERRPATDLAEVLGLFTRHGGETYDEDVTQSSHARQCAASAAAAGEPEVAVAAALLHDVGHLLSVADGVRDRRHEDVGARWLAGLFDDAVLTPIRLHVDAKRYLCATDRAYRRLLSEGSERSLVGQGGPFTPEEAERFESRPGWEAAVALRRHDDRAKDLSATPAPLETFRDLLARVSAGGRNGARPTG
jgi:predicted HD phosphohydrolase